MKKKRVIVYIIIIAIMFFTLSGSWSRKEPKHLAVGISYLYDIDDEGNIETTVEYLDVPSGGATANSNNKFVVMKHKGKTPPISIRDPELTIEKDFFGSHNKVRFFSEKFAKQGVLDIFDFFTRGYITDERPYLVVVKNEDPSLIFKADKVFSDRVGDYINEMAETRKERTLNGLYIRTTDFMTDYYIEGKQCVMGVVEAKPNPVKQDEATEENKPLKYYMSFEGMAVFKEDKFLGYAGKEETMSYRIVCERVEDATVAFSVEGKDVTAVLRKSDTKIKTEVKDGKPVINITVKNRMMISQNNSEYCICDKDDVKIVEKLMDEEFSKRLKDSIAILQTEFKSDIYGFGAYLHMQHPKEWKAMKSTWDEEYFPNAEIIVTVKTCIDYDGQSLEKFGEKNVKQRRY